MDGKSVEEFGEIIDVKEDEKDWKWNKDLAHIVQIQCGAWNHESNKFECGEFRKIWTSKASLTIFESELELIYKFVFYFF